MYNYTYQAGISSNLLNAVYAPQQKEYWCWTASITNILKAYGINNVTQQEFAKNICGVDIWGYARNCPATNYDISRSLNFYGYDQTGNYFEVKAPLVFFNPDVDRLYEELLNNKPVLVAYRYANMPMGHAVVITGCECGVLNGKTFITKLFVRDPAPNALNKFLHGRKEITDVTGFLNSVYSHWYVDVFK